MRVTAAVVLLLAAACIKVEHGGSAKRDSTAADTTPAARVDTVVRVETVLVHDTLTATGTIADTTEPVTAPPLATGPLPTDTTPMPVTDADLAALRARRLLVPIAGIAPARLPDTFNETRGGTRKHEALDIMAPRNTPVRSVDDGRIVKLFTSKLGGLTVYAEDPSGRFLYYYAHLDHYPPGLAAGQTVHRGDVIGYVGTTGDAAPDAPHLHFAIERLRDPRVWWRGTPIDPTPIFQASGTTTP